MLYIDLHAANSVCGDDQPLYMTTVADRIAAHWLFLLFYSVFGRMEWECPRRAQIPLSPSCGRGLDRIRLLPPVPLTLTRENHHHAHSIYHFIQHNRYSRRTDVPTRQRSSRIGNNAGYRMPASVFPLALAFCCSRVFLVQRLHQQITNKALIMSRKTKSKSPITVGGFVDS